MSKVAFAEEAQNLCTELAGLSERFQSSFQTFFNRGYDGQGSDPIVDADLTSLGITAANIGAFITLAENINKFLDNQSPFSSLYRDTVNDLRTDI